jgi:hypothetical protein
MTQQFDILEKKLQGQTVKPILPQKAWVVSFNLYFLNVTIVKVKIIVVNKRNYKKLH